MDRPTLILDADDTLWENNIYYERATTDLGRCMAAAGFDPAEAERTFAQVEAERVPVVGYAPHEFAHSMLIAYHRLCARHGREPDAATEREVQAIANQVVDHPITLLGQVAETMPLLHRCCRLILLTKGDPQVQQDKLSRSGLAPYLEAVHVVAEKDAAVLHELLARHGLDPRQTWMVGNSPRSDINPALAAGIGAVYIPDAVPWSFEQTAVADPDRVITLDHFGQLLDLFPEPGRNL